MTSISFIISCQSPCVPNNLMHFQDSIFDNTIVFWENKKRNASKILGFHFELIIHDSNSYNGFIIISIILSRVYNIKSLKNCVKLKAKEAKNVASLYVLKIFGVIRQKLCRNFYLQPVLKRKECKRFQGFAKEKRIIGQTQTRQIHDLSSSRLKYKP